MKRILIVDDDARIVERLSVLLAPSYAVSIASNGFDALARLDEESPDAVLLDLRMPGLDGSGFVEEMRKRGLTAPVILVSANPNVGAQAQRLGAAGWLAKPFDVEELEALLARI